MGLRARNVRGEFRRRADAEPLRRAGGTQHVLGQEAALLHPVGNDGERHLAIDRVRLNQPDVEETSLFSHEGSPPVVANGSWGTRSPGIWVNAAARWRTGRRPA